ncbi:MAG TPA: hypothetical protein PK711_05415 [Bacteroidales bacterium]|nr:hypothetical protein [Bacteroidales bacterium]HRZ20293.1 hypothetical protein [Bacteroidales bacterium]
MKRVSFTPLWYFIIACFLVTLNSGVLAQQTSTSVQTKEKTTGQQKPRLQVDTVKSKPTVKPVPGAQKDKVPAPQQKGTTQDDRQKNTQKTWEDDQTTGTKESPRPKDEIDVKGEKTPPQKDATDMKGEGKEPAHYEHRVEKDQQGHAYGKDKGGLEGKEFGQERAEQAKMNRETKSKELNESILEGEQKVKEARERIEVAKVQLEKDKQMGRISEQVFQERKEKISKAEQAVSDLEYSLYMGKKAISR